MTAEEEDVSPKSKAAILVQKIELVEEEDTDSPIRFTCENNGGRDTAYADDALLNTNTLNSQVNIEQD